MESDKPIEAMAQAMAQIEYPAMSYEELATAALNALRDTLGYDPQAAFNAGLERAAVIAESGMHNEYGRPQPALVAAIRAEKEKQ